MKTAQQTVYIIQFQMAILFFFLFVKQGETMQADQKKKSSKILFLQNATDYALQMFILHKQIKTNPLLKE